MIGILISVLIFLICCSAFFSASETALFSLSSMKVKAYKQDPDKRKQLVALLLSRPRELLVTIIMVNTIVNILVQNIVSTIFGDYSTWFINVGVPLALTLIFGEVIPKSIGLANNSTFSYKVAKPLAAIQRLLLPIRKLLSGIISFVSSFMFFFLEKEKEISVDELQHALKTSKQYGVLNEDEAQLVQGYLNLEESNVKEFMRPREDIIFYDTDEALSKLIHLFVDQECSRLPVCKESLDNILGIISSRIFFLHRPSLNTTEDLLRYVRKPFFVPETMHAKALLSQLYDRKESQAIVVDEYGSVSGLITLEDLVEQVVGEISDRRDEKYKFTRAKEDVIIASGKLELSEFEAIFSVPLISNSNMVTIGGWLTEQLGDIPKTGTKFTTDAFFFHVLAADPNRVRRVYIRRLKPSAKKKKGLKGP
ncbi:MAG TPA: hemolysin family protein [Rhabdochlamydiaceae bacterium]|nr:hemolysin family protein [Rhabdochlamydiaceae bacterium]